MVMKDYSDFQWTVNQFVDARVVGVAHTGWTWGMSSTCIVLHDSDDRGM